MVWVHCEIFVRSRTDFVGKRKEAQEVRRPKKKTKERDYKLMLYQEEWEESPKKKKKLKRGTIKKMKKRMK